MKRIISRAPADVAAILVTGGWEQLDENMELWRRDGRTLHWIPAAAAELAARTVNATG